VIFNINNGYAIFHIKQGATICRIDVDNQPLYNESSFMGVFMPLLPVYYTTTNLRKRKQTKHDRSEHDAWLAKMGVSPKQIKSKKTSNKSWAQEYSASLKVENSTKQYERSLREVCNSLPEATAKRGVMANLHKENEETRKAILDKAKRVMPLYNKGGLQVLTDSDDLKALNKVAR
jgi:hypothetical protein